MTLVKAILSSALALTVGACASVSRGWHEEIEFRSTPPGAQAIVTRLPLKTDIDPGHPIETSCTTPCRVRVLRNDEVSVDFVLAGYQSQRVQLTRQIATDGAVGVAGNILIGGATGALIDAGSGAATDHKPNPVDVLLARELPISAPPARGRR